MNTELSASSDYVIGIDLGGTAIKLGCFDRTGHCLQSLTVPTPQPASPEAVLQTMVEAIAQIDPTQAAQAIGVGTPGPACANGRIARVAINLAGWTDVPLADWLEAKTGKPTILANDANCAGLGEYWLGAGRQFQDVILLTLGTGVGGAVILRGELFVGREGTGAELGLITLNPEGPECNSGNRGSLEQYASVLAIRRRTGLEPEELGKRAQTGDPEAIAFWQQYGRDLGAGLASLIYVLTPEAVIIGGGVSASAEFFFPSLQDEIERRVLSTSRSGLQILPAELGNQAGIVGAAKLAWQKIEQSAPPAPAPVPAPAPTLTQPTNDSELLRLQLACQMAMEMAKFKAGFLARTSHELRSPLNSVISLLQLILSDLCDSPAEEREFVGQAHTAAKRMLILLDELVNVSKSECGTAQLEIQPVSINAAFEDVHYLTYLQARNRNLQLSIEIPTEEVYVLADPRWLKQVLLSLVHTPLTLMQEGTVHVRAQVDTSTEQVHIWVEDQRPVTEWSEPINLLRSPQSEASSAQASKAELIGIAEASPVRQSPGLTLLSCQALMTLMNGTLTLLAAPNGSIPADGAIAPSVEATPDLTRIQCSLPYITPEL